MSGSAAGVLAIARQNLGYHEGRGNANKFSAYWHHRPEAWCADFACYCLKMAGALDVPMSAYTPTLYGYFAARHRAGHVPRVGALAFFRWAGSPRIDHVEIVESVRGGGSIIDIGGNVRDQVMRNVRRGYIAGYGYPIYGGAAPAAPASHPATHPAGHANPYPRPTGIIQLGSRGNGVKYVQWALGFNTQDGIFGSGTLARVIQFQRAHGLAVDGQVGPHTLGVLAGVHR